MFRQIRLGSACSRKTENLLSIHRSFGNFFPCVRKAWLVTSRMHNLPKRPNNCPSMNCILPLSFYTVSSWNADVFAAYTVNIEILGGVPWDIGWVRVWTSESWVVCGVSSGIATGWVGTHMRGVKWKVVPAKFKAGICEMKILGFQVLWCIFGTLVRMGWHKCVL